MISARRGGPETARAAPGDALRDRIARVPRLGEQLLREAVEVLGRVAHIAHVATVGFLVNAARELDRIRRSHALRRGSRPVRRRLRASSALTDHPEGSGDRRRHETRRDPAIQRHPSVLLIEPATRHSARPAQSSLACVSKPPQRFVMSDRTAEQDLMERLWTLLGGEPGDLDAVTLEGSNGLPTLAYDVNAARGRVDRGRHAAAATVEALRAGGRRARSVSIVVTLEQQLKRAASRTPRLVIARRMWTRSPVTRTKPRTVWIRLHTNYRHHREAAVAGPRRARGERRGGREGVATWEGECARNRSRPGGWMRGVHALARRVGAPPAGTRRHRGEAPRDDRPARAGAGSGVVQVHRAPDGVA